MQALDLASCRGRDRHLIPSVFLIIHTTSNVSNQVQVERFLMFLNTLSILVFAIHCRQRVHSFYTTRISQISFSIGQGLSGCELGPNGMKDDGSGMWRVGEMFGALTLWVMSIKSWSVQYLCTILRIRDNYPTKVDWNYVIDWLGQQIHNTIFCNRIHGVAH